MNYDITFCEGDKCSARQQCRRWRLYQVYTNDPNPTKKPLVSMVIGIGGKDCPLFWPDSRSC